MYNKLQIRPHDNEAITSGLIFNCMLLCSRYLTKKVVQKMWMHLLKLMLTLNFSETKKESKNYYQQGPNNSHN